MNNHRSSNKTTRQHQLLTLPTKFMTKLASSKATRNMLAMDITPRSGSRLFSVLPSISSPQQPISCSNSGSKMTESSSVDTFDQQHSSAAASAPLSHRLLLSQRRQAVGLPMPQSAATSSLSTRNQFQPGRLSIRKSEMCLKDLMSSQRCFSSGSTAHSSQNHVIVRSSEEEYSRLGSANQKVSDNNPSSFQKKMKSSPTRFQQKVSR